MAQVTGSTDFDGVWEEWSNTALILVREAANRYAQSGPEALDTSQVVATLLSVLARPRPATLYHYPRWPMRFFEGPVGPPSVEHSLEQLAGHARTTLAVISTLEGIVATAAGEWALGNPEQPDTRQVLHQLFTVLWSHRLIPHPPSKTLPRGL
jgi:hypothetical protein